MLRRLLCASPEVFDPQHLHRKLCILRHHTMMSPPNFVAIRSAHLLLASIAARWCDCRNQSGRARRCVPSSCSKCLPLQLHMRTGATSCLLQLATFRT